MNKLFIASSLVLVAGVSHAQDIEIWSEVPVLLDSYGHSISSDGSYSTGEVLSAEGCWGRNNTTGEVFFFENASFGAGNHITKDKISVGTDMSVMKGVFLLPGDDSKVMQIPSLGKYYESYVHGINWDGTRLVGILSLGGGNVDEVNPDLQKMSYFPFYCNVDPETLTVSDPIFLPVPERDFFDLVPQYCTAYWISDDATTILGQVIDNSGSYIYPIVYKQGANGEWAYSLPSEKLFNPDGMEIPKWPVPAMEQPQAADYIGNPELKKLFEELLQEYLNGESTIDPYMLLDPAAAGPDALMNEEEFQKYYEDSQKYLDYYNTVYQKEMDVYYEAYSRFISKSTRFLQSNMAMDRSGKLIGQSRIVTRFSGTDPITYYNPVVFDLENATWKIYGDDLSQLEINQILPDGTLIATTSKPGMTSPDLTPQHSYVCAPGSDNFITIENYIKNSNPDFYQWYEDYLHHEVPIGYDSKGNLIYKDMIVSGIVAVNDDFTALSGGVDTWSWDFDLGDYITYFFTNMVSPDAAVDSLESDKNNIFKVFNLQGVKLMESDNLESVKNLPKGIYIINDKKILVK